MMEKNESAMMEKEAESGAVMEAKAEKLASNYYRYDPSTYEQLSREKLVFFNFRANWCPICNSERPGILAAFNEMDYGDVVGFEVHYNDPETKDFDNELIRKYQVAYQHTKIILDKDGNQVIKTLEFFDKERVKSEIEKVRSV